MGCHFLLQCMKVKSESEVTQSCPTLHNPMDCSLPGSSVHGIFQARVLEWGAFAFSIRGYYQSLKGVVVVHMLTWKNIPFIFSGEKSPVNSPLPSPPTLLPPLLLLRLYLWPQELAVDGEAWSVLSFLSPLLLVLVPQELRDWRKNVEE